MGYEEAKAMRERLGRPLKPREVAEAFGLALRTTQRMIVKGVFKSTQIGNRYYVEPEDVVLAWADGRRKVSRAIALEMREMKRRGGTYQEIADKFGVTVSTVWMYVH